MLHILPGGHHAEAPAMKCRACLEGSGGAPVCSMSQGMHSSPVVTTPAADSQRALGPLSKGTWEGKRAEREHRHIFSFWGGTSSGPAPEVDYHSAKKAVSSTCLGPTQASPQEQGAAGQGRDSPSRPGRPPDRLQRAASTSAPARWQGARMLHLPRESSRPFD